jgi:type II secretory pathway pseudopilin PulG
VIVIAVVGGVLVIFAVIGIVAAIAIPNLLTAMQRSKQVRTVSDMRTIAAAIEAYAADRKSYPDPATLEEAVGDIPEKDGWGNDFTYNCWSSTEGGPCDTYAIASAGKDGTLEHDSPDEYAGVGATTNFNDDIVMIDGQFVQYPQGVSVQ